MHLFIGLFFFSALMIVLNLAAYYVPSLPLADRVTAEAVPLVSERIGYEVSKR